MSKRDEYVEKLKTQLDDLNADIYEMQTIAQQASGNAKLNYEETLNSIRKKRDEIQQSLDQIKESADDTWEGLKKGVENVLDSLTDTVKKSIIEFKRGYKEGSDD